MRGDSLGMCAWLWVRHDVGVCRGLDGGDDMVGC